MGTRPIRFHSLGTGRTGPVMYLNIFVCLLDVTRKFKYTMDRCRHAVDTVVSPSPTPPVGSTLKSGIPDEPL